MISAFFVIVNQSNKGHVTPIKNALITLIKQRVESMPLTLKSKPISHHIIKAITDNDTPKYNLAFLFTLNSSF